MTETSPNDSFQKYVLLSLGLHASIVLLFTLKVAFFPSQPIVFQSALRVDLVALPDKAPPDAPAAAAPAPAPAAPAKAPPKTTESPAAAKPDEPTVNLNPAKPDAKSVKKPDTKKLEQKQDAAINRLKQQSALDRLERDFREAETNRAREAARTFKGNVISKGSDLTGIAQLEHDEYVATVERHVRAQWALPQWLANKDLKAQVRVKFDERGNVIGKQLVRSSGNAAFDEVVMETITKASPAPTPPEKFVRLLANEGILFGFPE